MGDRYSFTAEVYEWSARRNWFFVSIPRETSEAISDKPRPPRGFGSVRVRVTIGGSRWTTSIFPNSTFDSYSLPLKKSVRVAEAIEPSDSIAVEVELLE